MQIVWTGGTRVVLLVGRWAIKVPRVDGGARNFLLGLLGNMNEFRFSEAARAHNDRRVARTYWCGPLGCVAVAERITGPLIGRRMTEEEAFAMPLMEFSGECGVDDNGHNLAYREDGTLVALDYGHANIMYMPEGPRTFRGTPRTTPAATSPAP